MAGAQARAEQDVRQETGDIIRDMRASVASGEQHWFLALLEAVRQWPLPCERVGDRDYRYVVGGEAFDWLLLAERLCEALGDLVPADEAEALLFDETLPLDTDEEEFRRLLGAKYKAHLNFVYGVRVESALQMAVREELRKERQASRIWENGTGDDEVFRRIYGQTEGDLLSEYVSTLEEPPAAGFSLAELNAFRYWLFQFRVRSCDPAKVASDTRKGLALLQRLDRTRRPRPETAD